MSWKLKVKAALENLYGGLFESLVKLSDTSKFRDERGGYQDEAPLEMSLNKCCELHVFAILPSNLIEQQLIPGSSVSIFSDVWMLVLDYSVKTRYQKPIRNSTTFPIKLSTVFDFIQ